MSALPTFTPGLVSVTFRKLSPQQVVELVRDAKLESLEWGGDVHVPHGDLARAREVARLTRDAGLAVAAYGSYYRAGGSEAEGLPFEQVLATAIELGAPTIRVWAGNKGSADGGPDDRRRVVEDLLRIVAMARGANVTVSLEYHGGTLTDSIESTAQLLAVATAPNLFTLWQPPNDRPVEHCVDSLRAVLPRLGNVHVFHWTGPANDRHALADGAANWRHYLDILRAHGGGPRHLLLEFVRDDSPEQLLKDAATLREWLALQDPL